MYSHFEQFLKDWENESYQFILTTSGTTGQPKPLKLDRKKLEFSAKLTLQAIAGINSQYSLCCLPTSKMGGFMQLVRAAIWNTKIKIIQPTKNPMLQLDLHHGYQNVSLSPLQVNEIWKDKQSWDKLMRFSTILIGGAACAEGLIEKINNTSHKGFYCTYGMTETYSHIALRRLPNEYFTVLGNIKVRVNAMNELEVCSFLTDNQWLNTHDLIRIMPDLTFELSGRKDNLINTGGVKFHAENLESAIYSLIKSPFFITGIKDSTYGEAITLVLSQDDNISLDQINKALSNEFGAYAKVRNVVHQAIYFNEITGKIKREVKQ